MIILFLISNLYLFSSNLEKKVMSISNVVSVNLYNYDDKSLEKIINNYIQQNDMIESISIIDNLDNNIFYQVYKKENKLIKNKSFHTDQDKYIVIKKDIVYKSENIGKIIVYFKKFDKIKLTTDEKQWLKDNPEIKIAIMDYWDLNDNGNLVELELINLINRYMGTNIIPISYSSWKKGYNDAKTGKDIQGIARLNWSQEREEKYFYYTPTYNFTPLMLVTKSQNSVVKTINDLNNRSLYIVDQSIVESILKNIPSNTTIIKKDNPEATYRALRSSKGYHGLLSYDIKQKDLKQYNLKIVDKIKNKNGEVSIGINHKYPILASIITKAFKVIPKYELINLTNNSFTYNYKIDVTQKEKQWIKDHPVVNFVSDPYLAPFEFIDEDGKYSGISSSYIDIISKRTGIKFNHKKTAKWSESIKYIDSKKVDMYSCITKTVSTKDRLNFTKPYLKYSMVMVTTQDKPFLDNIKSLYNKTVVVIKGYAITELLFNKHPNIKLIYAKNSLEALQYVSSKKAYAFVSVLPIASYNINKNGFFDLKIAGKLDTIFSLSIALRKELGQTGIDIINKALDSITEHEKDMIYNKWVGITLQERIDYTLLWKIFFGVSIILAIIIYWNRRLQAEIKQRKKIEQELIYNKIQLEKETKKAQIASKSKSEFLANMSHEIRTPMNAVIGFTYLLDKLIKDPVQKDYLHSIKTGGKALLMIINDILDLSKIEAGKLELDMESTEIRNIFTDMENIFHSKIKQKNLDFILDIDDKLPQNIIIDSARVRQVLINLIGNAIKFTESGSITVKVEMIFIDKIQNKIDLKITVTDTGRGIPKEYIKTIFNSFEQIERDDSIDKAGTGLGLAICDKLIKLMGGDIVVKSEVGKGSSFIVTIYDISIGTNSIKDRKTEDIENITFKDATILVVDDIAQNRKLIEASLSFTNLSLLEASNGKEALEMVSKYDIDLILMDIRMPVMNGYETIKRLKSDPKTKDIPVIAFTASVMVDELNKVEEYGFSGYVRKPMTYEDLIVEFMKHLKYDIKKEIDSVIDNISLDSDILDQLPYIVDKLKGEFRDELDNIKDKGDFELLKTFANKIDSLNLDNKLEILSVYSSDLLKALDSFDINKVEFIVNNYDKIYKRLDEIIKDSKG